MSLVPLLHFRCSCWGHLLAQSLVLIHWHSGYLVLLSWYIRPHYKQIQRHHLAVHLLIPDQTPTFYYHLSSHHLIPFISHFILISAAFFYFYTMIQTLKLPCWTSLIKTWFVPTKHSLSEFFPGDKRQRKVRSMDGNKQMNQQKKSNEWNKEKSRRRR